MGDEVCRPCAQQHSGKDDEDDDKEKKKGKDGKDRVASHG